jgi:hypothetical protein
MVSIPIPTSDRVSGILTREPKRTVKDRCIEDAAVITRTGDSRSFM